MGVGLGVVDSVDGGGLDASRFTSASVSASKSDVGFASCFSVQVSERGEKIENRGEVGSPAFSCIFTEVSCMRLGRELGSSLVGLLELETTFTVISFSLELSITSPPDLIVCHLDYK